MVICICKEGTVFHNWTESIDDTKNRLISVDELFVTQVGSETTWVRLNDEVMDKSLDAKVYYTKPKICIKNEWPTII